MAHTRTIVLAYSYSGNLRTNFSAKLTIGLIFYSEL